MTRLIRSPLEVFRSGSPSFLPHVEPGLESELLLADTIAFIRLGQRARALECLITLLLHGAIDPSTSKVLFKSVGVVRSDASAERLLGEACTLAVADAREAGLARLAEALASDEVLFAHPSAVEQALKALQVART